MGERGFSLIEAVVSAAILLVAAGATLAAFGAVARVSAPDPGREAAERELRRIATIANAVAKYRDPNSVEIATAPWEISAPSPAGTPIALTVTAARSGGPPTAVIIAVRYPSRGTTAVLSRRVPLVQKAPAPGDEIAAPGTYADPGAP